ncbi:hypothetical protein GW17_00009574 [Ensete ventricosum]|nr:hypothetical protein GW17_00009574 [Ensete ventricosum]
MGRAPCCDKANVKKGPWSPEEDAKLKAYIEENGTGGNWIALPHKIGLWSIIAAQLPGRTDNDVKNYWNTKLQKKLFGKRKERHLHLNRVPILPASALERMQLQGLLNSPFSFCGNPEPWPKHQPPGDRSILASISTDSTHQAGFQMRSGILKSETASTRGEVERSALGFHSASTGGSLSVETSTSSFNAVTAVDVQADELDDLLYCNHSFAGHQEHDRWWIADGFEDESRMVSWDSAAALGSQEYDL